MNSSASGPARPILNWNVVQLKSSWGVLILIGGGYAIADASNSSGFSDWVAEGLAGLVTGWEPWTVCLLCSTMAALFTEITSNSASCALFVPLLDKLVRQKILRVRFSALKCRMERFKSFYQHFMVPRSS